MHELQKTIETNPEISSAALLERFRGTENEKALQRLSMLQTPETENTDNITDVYKNLIERLHDDDRYEYFKHKINNDEQLTDEEQKEYLQLCTK